MPAQDEVDEYGTTWRCWDCGVIPATSETPPAHLLTRYGTDGGMSAIPQVPDGCTQITRAQYDAAQEELRLAREAWWADYEATHPAGAAAVAAKAAQTEDDRIAELVAVKVAEALAAQAVEGAA